MKLLIFFSLIPLFTAFLIVLLGRLRNQAVLLVTAMSVYLMKIVNASGVVIYKISGWSIPLGVCLVADGLTVFMLCIVNLVALLVIIYSCQYMRGFTDKWKFYSLFMLMLAGMNGIIISGDLFNLYIFLEVASIAAYALVAFGIEPEDLEASFKYAIMGAIASVFILLGIALLYSYTSTLNMADIALIVSGNPGSVLVSFVSVLFLAGFGLKAALVPFHAWLPDAHSSAPSPVSAMLSGVFVKTLGLYALSRVFFNLFSISSGKVFFALMFFGVLSMVVGALLAMAQTDIKRMLAYSTISQVGYIAFAFGVGTPLAIAGGLFHILNHAASKSLLFLNAGAIEHATGTRDINKLGGLNQKIPLVGFTSLFGSMSISGVPPFGGFWSKLMIITAAVQAGHIVFSIVAILVSVLTLVYYLKFQSFVFFGKLRSGMKEDLKSLHFGMKFSMVVLAVICLLTGMVFLPQLKLALDSAVNALLVGNGYGAAVIIQ
ncbi:MAG: NADH/ubiquinone/plastoquinone (complex I) [Candidatus Omnitrophica bacterium]|nr:NADH/ubiquinone/plastoquinone (complex I) [Candidatus Omnitrophota bacterium]